MNEHGTRFDPSRLTRKWFCVAYAFPPINRSGTHRTAAFVKHLDRLGWRATVLTVEPGAEPRDESLVSELPRATKVIRTRWGDPIAWVKQHVPLAGRRVNGQHAAGAGCDGPTPSAKSQQLRPLRDCLSRLLITPDSRIGWIGPGVRAGLRAIRRDRPEVIYSTSPYMSAHLIALLLAWRTRLPWVADFRDPWRDNPFRDIPQRVADRWDAWLEARVLNRANAVICNTPTMTARLVDRVPRMGAKVCTILNGFDAERFADVQPIRSCTGGRFLVTHCGQFYGPRSPHVWFDALRRLKRDTPQLAERIRFCQIGGTRYGGVSLRKLADEAGVGDCVLIRESVAHDEAIAHMAGSDALVLAGSSGNGAELQVPNKLFEYLALRRPIIATMPSANPSAEIMRRARAIAAIHDPRDAVGVAMTLRQMTKGDYTPHPDAWSGVGLYDRVHRAGELRDVLDRVTGCGCEETATKPRSRVLRSRLPSGEASVRGVAGSR